MKNETSYGLPLEAVYELSELETVQAIYNFTTEKIHKYLAVGSYICVVEYDFDSGYWEVRSIRGLEEKHHDVSRIFGFDLNKLRGIISTKYYEKITSGKLTEVDFDLPGLFNNRFSKKIENIIKKVLSIENMYCISFQQNKQIFGNLTIVTNKQSKPFNPGLIESFVIHVTAVIKKIKTEEALKRSESIYRRITNETKEVVWSTDLELNLTFISPSATNLFGFTQEENLRMPIEKRHPPEYIPYLKETLARELEKEIDPSVDKNRVTTIECEHFKADGSRIFVSMRISLTRDKDNNIIGIQGVTRDISEQKRTEAKLNRSYNFQRLTSNISVSLVKTNESNFNTTIDKVLSDIGLFFQVDRSYLFIFSEDINNMSNINEWCNTGIEPQIENYQEIKIDSLPWWKSKILNGEIIHIPDVNNLPDEAINEKNEFLKQNIKSLISIPVSTPERVYGFIGCDAVKNKHQWSDNDISNLITISNLIGETISGIHYRKTLKLAKEKAEESDRLKTAFINNISHEIRTPLNTILGFGEILLEPVISPEERKEYLKLLQKSSARLIQTVDDYLDISMLVSETQKVNLTEFELNPLLEEITNYTYILSAKRNIEVEIPQIDYSYRIILLTDRSHLKRVLHILIENAFKFTREGYIELGYKLNDDNIAFHVKDTGIGISDDKISDIFKPFNQEDYSSSRNYEGSGLGLAIAKGLTGLIGGSLNVDSNKSMGSTFHLELPYTVKSIQKLTPPEANSSTKENQPSSTVLIVEDDDLNYSYTEAIIKNIDIDHLHASNGAEAVSLCHANPNISLIIMDIKMPVMNGIDATRHIRLFRPEVPIIALTAYAEIDEEHKAIEAGCNEFYTKPINPDILAGIIKKYIPEKTS